MLKVAKFGGSSVAGAQQFKKVKAIMEAEEGRKIIVVSAAGKRSSDDHKLTDLLYLCHAHITYGVSCAEIVESIRKRFVEIRDDLDLEYNIEEEFDKLMPRLNKSMGVDELVSRGEYLTGRLMAEYLGYKFVDAADVILFGFDGHIDREKTYKAIKDAYEKHGKILIPGFYGKLPGGKIKLMSRGGSDITGAMAAAAVQADVYENWTDVSGILMADPRIVDQPSPIEKISYAELRELAYMGASVLHEESILPVKEPGIALNIRNTNRPQDPGTMIVDNIQEDDDQHERFITGIAGRQNYSIITVVKRNMNLASSLRQALEILERYHAVVEHITLGLDTYAFVTATEPLGDSIYDILADLQKTVRPDELTVKDGISLVAAVGRKMTSKPGISGKLFKALGDNGVNIRTIAQGADELSIIVGVENADFEKAIRVLYEGFAG